MIGCRDIPFIIIIIIMRINGFSRSYEHVLASTPRPKNTLHDFQIGQGRLYAYHETCRMLYTRIFINIYNIYMVTSAHLCFIHTRRRLKLLFARTRNGCHLSIGTMSNVDWCLPCTRKFSRNCHTSVGVSLLTKTHKRDSIKFINNFYIENQYPML